MKVNTLHEWLGHPHFKTVINTANKLQIYLTGDIEECHSCAMAKARKNKISKHNHNKSQTPGERIYVDIIYSNTTSFGGYKYWALIVDKKTKLNGQYS